MPSDISKDGPALAGSPALHARLEAATGCLAGGDPAGAIEQLRHAVLEAESAGNMADAVTALRLLAPQLFAAGRHVEARSCLEALVRAVPVDSQAQLQLAMVLDRLGDGAASADALDRCLAADPGNAQALALRAGQHTAAKRHREAAECLLRLSRLQPDNLEARVALAVAMAHCGEREMAAEILASALATDPTFSEARDNLQQLLVELGWASGMPWSPPEELVAEAQYHAAAGRPALQRRTLAQSAERWPDDLASRMSLALFHVAQGDVVEALPHLESCAAQAPLSADEWSAIALARHRKGNTTGFARAIARAMAITPGHPASLKLLAGLHAEQGQWEEARPLLDLVLEQCPWDTDARMHRARCSTFLGDLGPARADYEEVLAVEPDHAVARRNLDVVLEAFADSRPNKA